MDEILGQRAEYRGEPAWHGKGNVFPLTDKVELLDAASRHWSDIKIHRANVYSLIPTVREDGSGYDMEPIQVEDTFNIFRLPIPEDPSPLYLGTVTGRWETKNPMWYAERLNELSLKYPLETLGTLGKGERVFFSLRDRDIDVSNGSGFTESLHSHFVFELSMKPGKASRAFTTRTRPVCSNTLYIGWKTASHAFSIPHTMDPSEAYSWMIQLASWAEQEAEFEREVLSQFMRVPMRVDGPEFKVFLEQAYKGPAVPRRLQRYHDMPPWSRRDLTDEQREKIKADERRYIVGTERAESMRATVRLLAERFNDEHGAVANTTYMAYNASTELATHRKANGREDAAESILVGARASEIMVACDLLQEHVATFSN